MKDNITDWALEQYRQIYKDDTITKQDIFYYTYGILHSPGFREKYQPFLVRGIPNIPYAPDFRAFEKAGRDLAYLHLNYETCPRYNLGPPKNKIPDAPRRVQFGTKKNEGDGTIDESKLVLDDMLVFDNIPHIDYRVNGLTPIGWFAGNSGIEKVSRYSFRTNSESGITNYPLEHVSGEEVLHIIERLVYVGMETDRIMQSLPEEFEMEVDMTQFNNATTLDSYNTA